MVPCSRIKLDRVHPSNIKTRRSPASLILVGAAVAIAGALVALRLHFQPPTLPPYAVVETADVVAVVHGRLFDMELRPSSAVEGAVAARAFLVRGDQVRPWDPPFSVNASGDIHIAGPVDTLFLGVPAGLWEVTVAVGRPELLPSAPRDVLRERDRRADGVREGHRGWYLVRERIRLEG